MENQKVLQAQKEAADQQKLVNDELRIQNAAKRKRVREEKAQKALQESEKITNECYRLEAVLPEPEHQPEELPIQLEKPEIKVEPRKYYSASEVRKNFEAARRPKFDFWEVLGKILKAYNDNNSKK